jgi:hydrogenase maturation protein HypF
MKRTQATVQGQVQGVGFRPTAYRVARGLGLTGHVLNSPEGVVIEVQGPSAAVDSFPAELRSALPPLARITSLDVKPIDPVPGETAFRIVGSTAGSGHQVLISPDVATCPDCLSELLDPGDRRHLYPFINCTNCGPRYTITRSLPYDRPTTSMACFPMCPVCDGEYADPLDRRFHAQPNACKECGPKVLLTDAQGQALCEADEALQPAPSAWPSARSRRSRGSGGFISPATPWTMMRSRNSGSARTAGASPLP